MKCLKVVSAVIGLSLMTAIGVTAAERARDEKATPVTETESVTVDSVATDVPTGEITMEAPTPIPPNTARRSIVVDTNGNRLVGSAAGLGGGKLIYSNNLGQSMFGPGGIVATSRIADDIGTIALPSEFPIDPLIPNPPAPACTLDRYVIRVNGDRSFTGLGVGDYTVTTALHDVCPGAKPDIIPGTEAVTTIRIGIDVQDESDIIEIVVSVPSGIDVGRAHYISIRFSRDQCGVEVGAPASVGFSGDRFDFPQTACSANLGGYPVAPHGSFGVDIYARELDCPDTHLAYRSTNHRESFVTPGVNKWFADDIRIGVPLCNLIGYEIAYKGNGVVQVDLRTRLVAGDPLSGGVIPGSRVNYFSSALDGVQVGRHMLAEPVQLTVSNLFLGVRTTSTSAGPLLTCKSAMLGTSTNLYFVHNGTEWVVTQTPSCFDSFDVTLFCEDLPPSGACCDMVLLNDENDAVCRDGLPEMNCPFPKLWEQGNLCEGICVGGSNDGAVCTTQVDCLGGDCDGPFPDPCGLGACCKPLNADPSGCENLTRNQCDAIEPVENPRIYDRGNFCARGGQRCPRPACIGRDGDCFSANDGICIAGINNGEVCDPLGFPVPCRGLACTGGPKDGLACPFSEDGGVNCGVGFECERGVCEGMPGCENPFCCSAVCNVDPFCCTEHWDFNCADVAASICEEPPSNDDCAPGNRQDGARLLQIPAVESADCINGTNSNTDPGFCCHNGSDIDPSLGPGSRGVNTVWFRFVAPTDTIGLDTCNSQARPGGLAEDSLIQLFEATTSDRGTCTDFAPCSVSAQDCLDDSICEFDVVTACENLTLVGCNDDAGDSGGSLCSTGEGRSKMCVSGLTPGNMYYVMVAAKSNKEELRCNVAPGLPCFTVGFPCENDGTCTGTGRFPDRGIYNLNITNGCQGIPLLENDRCIDATIPPGQNDVQNYPISIPFDMSGAALDTQPVSFDCPGPDTNLCFTTMENDIWYDWTAPADGMATIDACGPVDEFNEPIEPFTEDTGMVVYLGCGCPASTAVEDLVKCNDFQPFPCFLGSRVSFEAQAGQCYKIRLGGNFGDTPMGKLNINLEVPSCPDPIVFLDPETGTVDARQPFAPGTPFVQGINAITIEGDIEGATLDCWSICETDNGGFANNISSFIDHFDGTYTINLGRPISPGAVTTFTYSGDSTLTVGQFISHPGNTNGDAMATAADVTALIDYLTDPLLNALPWGAYSGDADQSGAITPGDILRTVDLMNGADGFDVGMGTDLPNCGACCPSP